MTERGRTKFTWGIILQSCPTLQIKHLNVSPGIFKPSPLIGRQGVLPVSLSLLDTTPHAHFPRISYKSPLWLKIENEAKAQLSGSFLSEGTHFRSINLESHSSQFLLEYFLRHFGALYGLTLFHLPLWPDDSKAPFGVSVIDYLEDNNKKEDKKDRNVSGRKRQCQTDPGSRVERSNLCTHMAICELFRGRVTSQGSCHGAWGVLLLFSCRIILFWGKGFFSALFCLYQNKILKRCWYIV